MGHVYLYVPLKNRRIYENDFPMAARNKIIKKQIAEIKSIRTIAICEREFVI